MCSNNSPTCVLSGGPSCIQGEHQPPSVATISSEVESPADFFCGLDPPPSQPMMSNHSRCCPMTGILPAITRSHDIAEEPRAPQQLVNPSTSKSNKSNKCGWKTSKFFSKTMSSGEILRGLKKLSLTSSGSASDSAGETESGKPRKSKSGQLKKRSSCGNDDDNTGQDEDSKARSPRSPGSFRPLSKAMSVSEPGSSSKTSNLGIVCRKEDLKAILCTASKKFPLASPSKRRRGQAPLRQTKSASFDTPEDRPPRPKEPVRRAGSEESRPKRPAPAENNESSQHQQEVEPIELIAPPPAAVDILMNAQNLHLSAAPEVPSVVEEEEGGSLSTVKWDECEVVDAVIIGDAIESFLKGSMSGSEKKVSFRRSSDRKVKSDG